MWMGGGSPGGIGISRSGGAEASSLTPGGWGELGGVGGNRRRALGFRTSSRSSRQRCCVAGSTEGVVSAPAQLRGPRYVWRQLGVPRAALAVSGPFLSWTLVGNDCS